MKKFLLFLFTAAALSLPPLYLLRYGAVPRQEEPVRVLSKYLTFLYARDLRNAYRYISSEDQRLKSQRDYARERGSFNGFALDAARKLAARIELKPVSEHPEGKANRVRVAMKLPDANALANLLHDWDEEKLNALPPAEQRKILATIDNLAQQKKLPMIEGEEEFVLVQNNGQWRIHLDWAAGVKVKFATLLPAANTISAEPTVRETVARQDDMFTIGFKVKNLTRREIVTRIVHRVEPKEVAPFLDLVECALLLPVRLQPGEEQTYNSTYAVRGDLPDGIKSFDVTYDFKIEN